MKKTGVKKLIASSLVAGVIFTGSLIIPEAANLTTVEAATNITQDEKIMGKSVATAHQMASFVRLKNPDNLNLKGVSIEELAQMFLDEGAKEGVRGDVAFAQSIKETGYFSYKGSSVSPNQHNYAGIGATGGGVSGNKFSSPLIGVRAQIQHLKAYASTEPLNQDNVDPRFHLVTRGVATTFPELHGRWAIQNGGNYGKEILVLHSNILKMDKGNATTNPATSKDKDTVATNEVIYKATANLNLRQTAGVEGKYITTIPKDATVTYVSSSKVGSKTWYKVTYKQVTGWASSDYLTKVNNTTATKPTVNETTKSYKTTSNLNVRATAGSNGKYLGTYKKGTVVTSSKTTKVSGTTWHYVTGKIGTKTVSGWVSGYYLK